LPNCKPQRRLQIPQTRKSVVVRRVEKFSQNQREDKERLWGEFNNENFKKRLGNTG
jgi:hypothetical protein